MGRTSPWFLLALSGMLAVAAAARGAPEPFETRESSPGLRTLVSIRYDDAGLPRSVVQVTVPYRSLIFRSQPDGFRSELLVTVVAQRGRSRVGGGVGQATANVSDYRATRGDGQLVCEVPLSVRGGESVTLLVTTQVVGTARRWEERLTHTPATGSSRLPVYCEELDWNAEAAMDRAALLDSSEDSLRVVCRLRRRQGDVPWPAHGVALVLSIRAERDAAQPAVRRRLLAEQPAASAVEVACVWPADGLPFGRLELSGWLELAEPGGERQEIGAARALVNLHIRWDDEAEWRRQVNWLEGRLETQPRQRLLRAPPNERPTAWRAAWDTIGAVSRTPGLELERAHLMRIVEADAQFGQFGRGALSDRGHIYVRYGAPDSIERHGDDLSREGQWEVWYYYEPRLAFTFYDAHGLGDYRLTGSTGL